MAHFLLRIILEISKVNTSFILKYRTLLTKLRELIKLIVVLNLFAITIIFFNFIL